MGLFDHGKSSPEITPEAENRIRRELAFLKKQLAIEGIPLGGPPRMTLEPKGGEKPSLWITKDPTGKYVTTKEKPAWVKDERINSHGERINSDGSQKDERINSPGERINSDCLQCGHTWINRVAKPPKQCPKCRSRKWRTPR